MVLEHFNISRARLAEWPYPGVQCFSTQLTDRRLGLRIIEILAETELPPQRLEIEITESTLVRDTEMGMAIVSDRTMQVFASHLMIRSRIFQPVAVRQS